MRKYTIKVQKTIQERQFEPYMLSIETTFTVDDSLSTEKRIELVDNEYYTIQEQLQNKIDEIESD